MNAEQTLTEHGLANSVWGKRILRAVEDSGCFSSSDVNDAGEWQTCACGEQDPRIPRMSDTGEPRDTDLHTLGMNFYAQVKMNKPDAAAKLLVEIERRSAFILKALELS